MQNVQRRTIDAPPDRMGALLDRIAGPDDPLWPAPAWPPMRFDRPLAPGATGGHGMIRYSVVEHVPGRLLRCRFDPAIGLLGEHELRMEPDGTGTAVVHVIHGRLTGAMRVLWPVAIRWLHEALLQDLLDHAERAGTGTVRRPARWSPWVRLLRRAFAARAATAKRAEDPTEAKRAERAAKAKRAERAAKAKRAERAAKAKRAERAAKAKRADGAAEAKRADGAARTTRAENPGGEGADSGDLRVRQQ